MSNSFEKKVSNNKKTNGKFKYITLSILLLVALLSTSYAIFTISLKGERKYSLTIGNLDFSLDNEQNAIRLMNAYPMSDIEGQALRPYTFTLTNTGTIKEYYKISLVTDAVSQASCDGCTFLSPSKLRYSLTVDSVVGEAKTVASETILETGELAVNQTKNYELRIWLNSSATIEEENKYYYGKIKVNASQEEMTVYSDNSGANPPKLTSGMIPVTYNETDKTWVKADTTEKWYDYEEQMWANAVTVTADTRDNYMSAPAGAAISMNDINTMWVWIPRYEYNYSNLGVSVATGEDSEIKINFIPVDTIIPSNNNLYRIPEGFKFGNENISGFWMGKFETSTLESCTIVDDWSEIDEGCDLLTLTPQIKPNVTSWRGARVSTFFEASRLMQSATATRYNNNTYGFDAAGTSSMDVHMLKNTEWGIAAMLSSSKYGKYGNPNYIGANKEVYQNKSSGYITGMSNGTPSQGVTNTQVSYDTPDTGYGASTTGTIYGVYDMSGGAHEHVMGNYNNISGNVSTVNSGFCGKLLDNTELTKNCRKWPESKYYDLYTSTTYKFGDATSETPGWYGDTPFFGSPWFERSVGTDTDAGVFAVASGYGSSTYFLGARFAIKP